MLAKFSRAGLIMILLTASIPVPMSHAAPPSAPACIEEMQQRLSAQQWRYRRVLFGLRAAQEENVGAIRYDREGNTWIKRKKGGEKGEQGEWRTSAEGFAGTTWTDTLMDSQAAAQPRRGIFETRNAATSELLPPLLQSVRALRCNLEAICESAAIARGGGMEKLLKDGKLPVTTLGCRELLVEPLRACVSQTEKTGTDDVALTAFVATYCRPTADDLLAREMELTKLLVSYDASYRSLLQFAGTFDRFASEFQETLFSPIRQAVSLLNALQRIPCFAPQCQDDPPVLGIPFFGP